MPIESGTTIAELDDSWPLSNDGLIEGDNHLRLIKAVLKDQFPGALGQGLASVITATEAEMNYLVGVTSSIQDQLDAIVAGATQFPVGHLLFTIKEENPDTYGYPGVWTLLAGDASLNLVGSGDPDIGVVTGNDSQSVPLLQHKHTMPSHNHSATFTGISHNHTVPIDIITVSRNVSGASVSSVDGTNTTTSSTTAGGTISVASKDPGDTNNTGDVTPTINVKGKVYNLLCWERVS